jgi:Glycosyl transferase family 2
VSIPRFSIVVPTTDRPKLLAGAVRAFLASTFQDFELVISDNCSKVRARQIVGGIKDERIRHLRTSTRLAASDHWEFIWEHLRGDYVMFPCDDNLLHPGILAFADRILGHHDLDVLSWRVGSYYHANWDIEYPGLPNRGNVLGLDAGTSGGLYRCDAAAVLRFHAQHLRFSGCFPCLLNFLFKRERGNWIRRQAGKLFWLPCPDVASSVLVLGICQPDGYAFWDGFGAIGGRSRDSNFASMLSRGKQGRFQQYVAESSDQDLFPLHQPKFISMSNMLAATVSQGRALFPRHFAPFEVEQRTIAAGTIDEMFVDRTLPIDQPAFNSDVDRFIETFPAEVRAEVRSYRDQRAAELVRKEAEPVVPASPAPARFRREEIAEAWRLFRHTWRYPFRRIWTVGGTTYVDMRLFGARDTGDVVRTFPKLLALFDKFGTGFRDHYRTVGMLGEELSLPDTKQKPQDAMRFI